MIYGRLIIEGNAVYEIDEECLQRKQGKTGEQSAPLQPGKNSLKKPKGSDQQYKI